jgi:adenosine deaminase
MWRTWSCDPSISDTTLTDEYLFAMAGMGFQWPDLLRILENGIEAAFLSPEERRLLARRLHHELRALGGAPGEGPEASLP